jgi:threonine dehydrogenase-like Zn-dependent dehydrogenase
MPDVLHLKPEDVDTVEKRGKYNVGIVGCGPLGLAYAVPFVRRV